MAQSHLLSPSPPPRRRRRSGTGRRERAEHPVRPTAARRACRAEPRPAPASLDAREAPVNPAGPSRAAAHSPRQARSSAPDAVRAGAGEDRRPAPRPRRPNPCPDAQRGRPGRPRLDSSSRPVHGHAFKRGRYRVSVVVIDAAGNRSATVRRPLRVRKRARTAASLDPWRRRPRGAAPRQRSPLRMISRICTAAGGSHWTSQSRMPVPRCWTLPRLGSRDHMTARIHGIPRSCASHAIRPLKSVTPSPR
jgi:hypothetical protein